ncbi:MAG TPA: cation:proton antiporter, partial [Bryobacteraceae bacterium]|nr:cation:proton antiporter [Bryobacteraceae bacterium]
MSPYELLITLLVVALLVAVIAARLSFPYPIALLAAGIGIAAFPGTPDLRLDPGLIFYILLPPILFEAAYFTSWRDFWMWRRPILLLSFGLVLATSAV